MANPNFMLIGAPKCGTSWLAGVLRQHHEIVMSTKKEVHYFDKSSHFEKGLDWYQKQFPSTGSAEAVGEATARYFAGGLDMKSSISSEHLSCAHLIHHHYPDLRLIVILRNPVDRLVSSFYQNIRRGVISPQTPLSSYIQDFPQAVEEGFYEIHLRRWQKFYSPKRILVLIFEESVKQNRAETIRKTLGFLNVDQDFLPDDFNDPKNARSTDIGNFVEHFPRRFVRMAARLGCPEIGVRFLDLTALRCARYLETRVPSYIAALPRWRIDVQQDDLDHLAADYEKPNRRLGELLGRRLPW